MRTIHLATTDGLVLGVARVDEQIQPRTLAVLTRQPGQSARLLANAVAESLPGHRLITQDRELSDALVAGGAILLRASRLMVLATSTTFDQRSTPRGVVIQPLRDRPRDYAPLFARAFPPDHPDHDPAEAEPAGATETLARYLSGEDVGPLITEASAEARSSDGACVAVMLVSEVERDEEFEGGPWLTQLFVDPTWQRRGIGRALIRHAVVQLIAQDRYSLALAVTSGSPAARLYDSLGFEERFESWALAIA